MLTLVGEQNGSINPSDGINFSGHDASMDNNIIPMKSISTTQIILPDRPTSQTPQKESHTRVACQIIIPYFIAGFAMVGAGWYLNMVQKWIVFANVREMIILVPALLGLKGNLEMTLASRLSTEANLGKMDDKHEQWSMIFGNLALVQCQAIVVGILSSVFAVASSCIVKNELSLQLLPLLCACSVTTASIASLVLGLVTSGVVVASRVLDINPDNVAIPIAGSLGDITSLALLSCVASQMYTLKDTWIPVIFIIIYLSILPLVFWLAKRNPYTCEVLQTGWLPVIGAMFISTLGGLLLDKLVTNYEGLSAFQPVINGVGGNLVSIQASRLSTALHQEAHLGKLPTNTDVVISPWKVFFSDMQYAITGRVLLFLVLPGHVTFAYCVQYFRIGNMSSLFLTTYIIAAIIQVAVLLYLAYVLTHYFWRRGVDPDNTTIPYLTAFGDLLGIVLLGLTFELLHNMGEMQRN